MSNTQQLTRHIATLLADGSRAAVIQANAQAAQVATESALEAARVACEQADGAKQDVEEAIAELEQRIAEVDEEQLELIAPIRDAAAVLIAEREFAEAGLKFGEIAAIEADAHGTARRAGDLLLEALRAQLADLKAAAARRMETLEQTRKEQAEASLELDLLAVDIAAEGLLRALASAPVTSLPVGLQVPIGVSAFYRQARGIDRPRTVGLPHLPPRSCA